MSPHCASTIVSNDPAKKACRDMGSRNYWSKPAVSGALMAPCINFKFNVFLTWISKRFEIWLRVFQILKATFDQFISKLGIPDYLEIGCF